MTLLSRVIATSIALSASAALAACSSDKEADPAPATTPPQMETVTETPATTVVEQDDDDRDDKTDDQQAESADSLTGDDALAAAYAHAGVDASTVTDKEVELDDGDDGKGPHWEIEFTSNGQEYEYDVDAATGAVLEQEVD